MVAAVVAAPVEVTADAVPEVMPEVMLGDTATRHTTIGMCRKRAGLDSAPLLVFQRDAFEDYSPAM